MEPWGEERQDRRFAALLGQLAAVHGTMPDLAAIDRMVNPWENADGDATPPAETVKRKLRLFNAGMTARRN